MMSLLLTKFAFSQWWLGVMFFALAPIIWIVWRIVIYQDEKRRGFGVSRSRPKSSDFPDPVGQADKAANKKAQQSRDDIHKTTNI